MLRSTKFFAILQIAGFLLLCYLLNVGGRYAPARLAVEYGRDYLSRDALLIIVHAAWMLMFLLSTGVMVLFFDKMKCIRNSFATPCAAKHLSIGIVAGLVVMFARNAFLLNPLQWQQTYTNIGNHLSTFPWMLVLITTLFTAVGEEVAFRGTVYGLANGKFSALQSVWISAILFGLFHTVGGVYDFTDAVLVVFRAGLILGASRWWTRSIYLAIGIHFGQDFLGIFWFGDKPMGVEPLVELARWGNVYAFAARALLPYLFPILVAWAMIRLAKGRDANVSLPSC